MPPDQKEGRRPWVPPEFREETFKKDNIGKSDAAPHTISMRA
jgi:hypothetical protein